MPKRPAPRPLNEKQQLFVREYLVDFNASAAARRAGYSRKSAGSQAHGLLKNPQIQAAIAKQAKQLQARVEVTAENVIRELGRLAFAGGFFQVNDQGLPYIDWRDLTADQAAAIEGLEVEQFTQGEGEDAVVVQRVKYRQASKRAALDTLAKHFGLLKSLVEHSGAVELKGRPEQELSDDEIVALLRERGVLGDT